jgi:hypothetical protein
LSSADLAAIALSSELAGGDFFDPIMEKNKNQTASEIIRQVLIALRDFVEGRPITDEFPLAVAKIK